MRSNIETNTTADEMMRKWRRKKTNKNIVQKKEGDEFKQTQETKAPVVDCLLLPTATKTPEVITYYFAAPAEASERERGVEWPP